jgi:2-(3-amino-3-carboxypropyl)histidine synthase
MEYELELERACELIRKNRARVVAIQLPDGLKPKAKQIVDTLHENTNARVLIWGGSCYGACDLPQGLQGVDLLIQFGHSRKC